MNSLKNPIEQVLLLLYYYTHVTDEETEPYSTLASFQHVRVSKRWSAANPGSRARGS